ncbi:MarR family winged helix-turn-helix transcriptional regulator [Streptomyces chrestomyceticus]|uniref:MarR family winged helix-turn-helix transcriptional regulator n=1 Tax=Streptomyces chrestomyceticus TaxID=68185 RepID=UPI0033F9D880
MVATVTRGLSPRMARLLLDGDTEGRYAGRNDSEEGYRLTMALAVAASQPGRAWSPADFHRALIYTPTEAGSWARRLRANKGSEYVEGKLTGMLLKARERVAERPPITCRHSGWEAVERARAIVDRMEWRCKGGGDTDLKNLTVRLELCEKTGGLDHELSLRRQAELMGCWKQTAADSNKRLMARGLLVLEASGAGTDQGSRWRLAVDELSLRRQARAASDDGAAPGHLPTAEPRGGRDGVPVVHTDTKALGSLVSHDAFHRYGHGTTGARILALLDVTEGQGARELREALAVHRTTISRRLALLVADGLVVESEGLYYLAKPLAGPTGCLEADEEVLAASAEQRGTAGSGERRRQRHARERLNYRRWKAARKLRRRPERLLRLVPEGVVNEETGEIIDPQWQGWDVSDPFRPVPFPEWAAAA